MSTISRDNPFRHFNESATVKERNVQSGEEKVKTTRDYNNNSLVDSFRLLNPPLQRTSLTLDSVFPLASAANDGFSAGNGRELTPFLSAAGKAAAEATPTGGALPSWTYSGLAGTSPRNFLGTNSSWPALQRFEQLFAQLTRMNFSSQFPRTSSSIPFMATSRELNFRESLDRLQKAIDLIPIIKKIDFLAALQIAPELVAKESDYFRFLRHANFDAKAAADRLVSYWKYRRSVFKDRAFRPMVMTGAGALNSEDIEIIKSGFVAYASKDAEGCPVVILDPSRPNTDTTQARMRAMFYQAQHLSEDFTTQTQGFVILCIVSVHQYDHVTMEAISMLVNTLPVKVKAWHIFDCIKDRNSLEQGFFLGVMAAFLHSLNKFTTYLYSAETLEDVAWELATEHGLPLESIPHCLGGTWTYDVFQQWLMGRMSVEQNHYSQGSIDGTMSLASRRIHASPRPHKRSKWDEEEKALESDDDDDDAKPRAKKSSEDCYECESVEGLLARFHKLVFLDSDNNHESSVARYMTLKPSVHFELRTASQDLLSFYGDKYDALDKAFHAISVHDKVDYMTALRVAPKLVLEESAPSRFLAFHGYDAEKAAQCIVRYWKERRAIFGERAFLPMTLTGDGALNAEDIQFHKCGNLAITGQSQQGSTVVAWDPSRRTSDDRGIRVRIAFYTWQVLSDNPVNRETGFITIHIIRAPIYDKVISEALPWGLSLFPIKLKAVHNFDVMKKIDLLRRGFVQGLLGITWSAYTSTQTFFHKPRHKDILRNLESQHGLSRTVIPACIGGSWSYDQFEDFWNERRMLERTRYSTLGSCSMTSSTTTHSQTHLAHDTVAGSSTLVSEQIVRRNDVSNEKLPAPISQRVHQEGTTINSRGDNHLVLLGREARLLAADETAAYFEAVQHAPQKVWEDECCPELFLRVEELDFRKAAIRLAKYWRMRSRIFGSRQYALMTQTGDDALGQKELSTLGTGFLNLLPNDMHGRSVLCIDPSLLQYDSNEHERHRCIFYMMSLMAENDKSQSDGAILIVRIDKQHVKFVDATVLDALSKAMPLRLSAVHLVSQEEVPMDVIRSLESLNATVHVHSDQSKDVLRSKLESYGLTKAGLPKFVNGEWGLESFLQWQELRMRIEWKIPIGLNGRHYSYKSSFPAMKPYTLLSDDEAAERKRRMSLIHHRRKQNRMRIAVTTLEENCSNLRQEKKKLLQENDELEAIYAKATSIVTDLQSMEYS